MPGPAPKHQSVRARANKSSTRAMLQAVPDPVIPPLPELDEHWREPWHARVTAWWDDVWSSPMAPEYTKSDEHGLYMMALLLQTYWTSAEPREREAAAREFRLQVKEYGLTPMSRRALQWEIERVDEAQAKGAQRRASVEGGQSQPRGKADPRAALRAV